MMILDKGKDEREDELSITHPGFDIRCLECDSLAVGVTSDVGMSNESGMWGHVSLVCANCGHKVDIWPAD